MPTEPEPRPTTNGADDLPRRRDGRRGSGRRWLPTAAIAMAVGLLVAGLVVRLPYYVLSPGSSRPTEDLISVSGAPTFDDAGRVDFLTVASRQVTPLEMVASWINPSQEIRSEKEMLGRLTPSENRTLDLRMMASSKDAAQYQALKRLGYDIGEHGAGAVIATVVADGPAHGLLVPGDVVVAVDGRPISFSDELITAVGVSTPGASMVFDVVPFDTQAEGARPARRVDVVLGSRPSEPSKGYLGVSTFTRDLSFDFPVDVSIDSGSVGGPSAGLAFTLGILDVLTPGSISGGLPIATTGTMSLDGTVGPVGGVHQKVVAARRSGVRLMLVPASEIDEARRFAGDLRIEPVNSLDDALAVLATIGGGDAVLPPVSTRR